MTIYAQDRRKLVVWTDGIVTTESDKSGRIELRQGGDRTLIGEYASGYIARAVVADLYTAVGSQVRYRMPTMAEARRLSGSAL